MKVYDYKCQCGVVEERMVRDPDNVQCRSCGRIMERLVSAPGMVHTNFANKTGFKVRK